MSSKTGKKAAQAAAQFGAKEIKVIPDAELAKQYREEREQKLWPSLQKSDALMRMYDAELAKDLNGQVDFMQARITQLGADVEELKRQLALANSIIETKNKALADMATVAGVDQFDVAPEGATISGWHDASQSHLRNEPGLTSEHGQDSIGG